MKSPRSKLPGYQNVAMRIYPKGVTPNVLIGGPVRVSPGFPLRACGNDRLERTGIAITQQGAGKLTPKRLNCWTPIQISGQDANR